MNREMLEHLQAWLREVEDRMRNLKPGIVYAPEDAVGPIGDHAKLRCAEAEHVRVREAIDMYWRAHSG